MNWEVRTMRSVTSYFNSALYRKNLSRFWPIWALYSVIWLFALPLNLLHHGGPGGGLEDGGPLAHSPGLFSRVSSGLLLNLGLVLAGHLWPAGRYGGIQLSGCHPLHLP